MFVGWGWGKGFLEEVDPWARWGLYPAITGFRGSVFCSPRPLSLSLFTNFQDKDPLDYRSKT